jgi:hypothetical protein
MRSSPTLGGTPDERTGLRERRGGVTNGLPRYPATVSGVDPLTDAIEATIARMQAKTDMDEQQLRVHRDIWRLYHTEDPAQRLTPRKMEEAFQREWERRGLPPEQLRGAGLTRHRIQQIVRGPEPQ